MKRTNSTRFRQVFKRVARYLWFRTALPNVSYRGGELLFRLLGRRPVRRGNSEDLLRAARILVVRLDKIGDVVLGSSFLRELRATFPEAWITLVVAPIARPLVEHCPYVNEVRSFDWRAARYLGPLHHIHALLWASRYLWPQHFDLAIIPRWDTDYYLATFLAFFSGAPHRLAYSEHVTATKAHLNRGFDRLVTHISYDRVLRHEVTHNIELIRFLGGQSCHDSLELWIDSGDEEFAERMLQSHGVLQSDRLVAIAPGAGDPKRCWPIDRFVGIGKWLTDRCGVRVLLIGGPGDARLGKQIEQVLGSTAINAIALATLPRTGALLKRCLLFVGNDSGPMHLAAAAGIPVVAISCHPLNGSECHDNAPHRFGPWSRRHTVLQPVQAHAPCSTECAARNAHCILGVTTADVQSAIAYYLPLSQNDLASNADARLAESGPVALPRLDSR